MQELRTPAGACASGAPQRHWTQVAALAWSASILYLVLVQPNHPSVGWWWAVRQFPLEWPVLLLTCLAIPSQRWPATATRVGLLGVLLLLILSKLADVATFTAYNRGFNPLVDMHLAEAAWRFGSGSVGVPLALGAVSAGLSGLLLMGWVLWWSLGRWLATDLGGRSRSGAIVAALVLSVVVVAEVGHEVRAWQLPGKPPGTAFSARMILERAVTWGGTLADLRRFKLAAANDHHAQPGAGPWLDRLRGEDVTLIYIESYGRSSLLNPRYAPTHTATLRAIEAKLREQGLMMRSAHLTAPMIGGQSWLAHASVASGLWIDTQGRYRALLASPRRTLFHLARNAGHRTVAVMPAITMAWPEGDYFGFDRILDADALEYRGRPYNWVTMPDQYTLKTYDRLERLNRPESGRQPLFTQIALISSHAPWLPVPPLLHWDDIDTHGLIFNAWADAGDPPAVVWREEARIREKFRLAVDYSLQVVGAYAQRHAADPGLLIALGDHEPARFVSEVDGFDVPIHIIGPPALIHHIDVWGWSEGLVPAPDAPVWDMDMFRDRFIEAFSTRPDGNETALNPSPPASQQSSAGARRQPE
jgi:hypothetical protein